MGMNELGLGMRDFPIAMRDFSPFVLHAPNLLW